MLYFAPSSTSGAGCQRRAERARLFEAVFTWVYTPRGALGGSGRPNRRRGVGPSLPAACRGLSSSGQCLPHSRQVRPPFGDHGADARPVRRARRHLAAAIRSFRRGGNPEWALRGHARGGPPTLSGGPGGVEHCRRCILAGGRGAGLKSATLKTSRRLRVSEGNHPLPSLLLRCEGPWKP
jgi:hypothetical protein